MTVHSRNASVAFKEQPTMVLVAVVLVLTVQWSHVIRHSI
jgi:hypothetical protein